jgi:hypothetical protein
MSNLELSYLVIAAIVFAAIVWRRPRRKTDICEKAPAMATDEENIVLRRMLGHQVGGMMTTDCADGRLLDTSDIPHIDWMGDSIEQIRAKMSQRLARVQALQRRQAGC